MMSAEQLRHYCPKIRRGQIQPDTALLDMIDADVENYRAALRAHRQQLPPDDLLELLPLMGWLLFEVSLAALWQIPAAYEALTGRQRAQCDAAVELIERAADAARSLPWPEFAPRALGAIRAQAITASKRDTETGYDDAWILHEEARRKHASFLDSHPDDPANERFVRDLNEVFLQLALAETGTACRTAERVLSRWVEELDAGSWTEDDSPRWTQRMYRELSDGVALGLRALDVANGIEQRWGFTHQVNEERIALPTSYRLPAVMTARAILLLLSMGPEMEALGRRPDNGLDSWAAAQTDLLRQFTQVYRYIERPVVHQDGEPWQMDEDHARSVVQLRLHLALLVPGYDFPTALTFHRCLELNPLNDDAVEAMSHWLAETADTGRRRGDANVIGSVTKPSFIRSVEAVRNSHLGDAGGYRAWRRQWLNLDRYHAEPGRPDRVAAVLHALG